MAASMGEVAELFARPELNKPGLRVMDIGCQNLYSATTEDAIEFILSRRPDVKREELTAWAAQFAKGSSTSSTFGGLNGSWLGDILDRAGYRYDAIDIFPGYKTTLHDLNFDDTPKPFRGVFDVVVNMGTTEHVLNQFRSFETIHDFTKVGGLMYFNLPMTGFLDHGYFCYNPMLFAELAKVNKYEIVYFNFGQPLVNERFENYILDKYARAKQLKDESFMREGWNAVDVPRGSIRVLLRKTREAPFRASVEISTTVAALGDSIAASYTHQLDAKTALDAKGTTVRDLESSAKAAMAAYNSNKQTPSSVGLDVYFQFVGAGLDELFPKALEFQIVAACLRENPADVDLQSKVPRVLWQMLVADPLQWFLHDMNRDKYLQKGNAVPVAADILTMTGEPFFNAGLKLLDAYNSKDQRKNFPLEIEARMIEHAQTLFPAVSELWLRLGPVYAALTPTLPGGLPRR